MIIKIKDFERKIINTVQADVVKTGEGLKTVEIKRVWSSISDYTIDIRYTTDVLWEHIDQSNGFLENFEIGTRRT